MSYNVPLLPINWTSMDGLASLNIYTNQVDMDHGLKKYPQIVQQFIYYHELYHLYANTPISGRQIEIELFCDEGSANELIELGKTKTEILGAMDMVLAASAEKNIRLKSMENYLSGLKY